MNHTWNQDIGFEGSAETEEISINLESDSALSSVTWNDVVPTNTKLFVFSSISYDNGRTWSEWNQCFKNSSIPQITSGRSLQYCKLKFKVVFEVNDYSISPSIKNISINLIPVLEFNNIGDIENSPEIWITKIGNGDISLINISKNNEEFKFTGLIDGETVYVDNENQDIETSLPVTYRYSNFNDKFLQIPVGVNVFKIQGKAKIQFRTEFKVLA